MNGDRFWFKHLLLPLAVFGMVAAAVEFYQWDLAIGGAIYNWEGGSWALRDHWLLEKVLHTGARNLMGVLVVVMLTGWLAGFRHAGLRDYQRELGYLLLTVVLSASLVSVGKQLSGVDCPWDLTLFGGDLPYQPIFSRSGRAHEGIGCFPAGHASAGYAWFGLYFVVALRWPRWAPLSLGAVVALGLLFGVVQQFRGAHFLSHDLWTLAICWLVAVAFSPLLVSGGRHNDAGTGCRRRCGYSGNPVRST